MNEQIFCAGKFHCFETSRKMGDSIVHHWNRKKTFLGLIKSSDILLVWKPRLNRSIPVGKIKFIWRCIEVVVKCGSIIYVRHCVIYSSDTSFNDVWWLGQHHIGFGFLCNLFYVGTGPFLSVMPQNCLNVIELHDLLQIFVYLRLMFDSLKYNGSLKYRWHDKKRSSFKSLSFIIHSSQSFEKLPVMIE